MKRRRVKNNKGITLIALVITVIVLLILAGVSIAMLTGNNGILTQAQNAKNRTEEARIEEENALENYEDYINNATLETATVGEIATGGNKKYSKNGTAIIPEGFAIVPGLDDVSKGLVISDVANDTENKGNQFVWIPVISESQYVRNKSYVDINYSQTAYTDTGYLPDGIQPTIPEGTSDEKKIGEINEQAERKAVVNSEGFYIGRYEAGKEGKSTLVSKLGALVWGNQTPEEFKEIAKDFSGNSEHVKSAMCSGIQWDMVMAFITQNDPSYDVTNTNEDRHEGASGGVKPSGEKPADEACNIYDLEGNCSEYIAEKNSYDESMKMIFRGGNYLKDKKPASLRANSSGPAMPDRSFRLVLYVK